jgi:hypothetical protein
MTSLIVNQLYDLTKCMLERELYINAVFYGERLITESEREDHKLMLAKAFIGIIN